MNVKQILQETAELIEPVLKREWEKLYAEKFGFNKRQQDLVLKMLTHGEEHNLRTGKRLRAALVYWGYQLGAVLDPKIYQAMAAVEFLHSGLLMQDDVMDQDELRRGKSTTQVYFGKNQSKHYGESMAYILGDILMTRGYKILLETGFPTENVMKAVGHLLDTVVHTCYGQALDISLETFSDWDKEDVLALHRTKTAIYTYENPLFIGAILAESDENIFKILKNYAHFGGVAFQLQDDILGVFGDTLKTGKSNNSDLLQGKRTLLLNFALKKGNQKQKEKILVVWGKLKANSREIAEAKAAIKETGSLEYSIKFSRDYALKAISEAEKLKSLAKNQEAVKFLTGIAQYMVEREI